MGKNTILKLISIILALAAVLAVICAVTVSGSGFLDLSNIVRAACAGAAAALGILAFAVWRYSEPKN